MRVAHAISRVSQQPRHSILVVDDDREIRESLAELLSASGYAVTTAQHGLEALAVVHAGVVPSVAIVDLIMPQMGGMELVAAFRRDPTLRSTYVVLVSATDRPPALSADAFFAKPYSVSQLLAKVEQLCIAHDEMAKLR